jgi:dienelactone hydrolase
MAAGSAADVEPLKGPPSDPPPVTPTSSVAGLPNTWQTTVTNLSGEDLAGPCHYFLTLANSSETLRGVFVIYDRGDSNELFVDPEVQTTAAALGLGMLFAQQCNAASFGDIQQNAFAGPGRALFTALKQLATSSSHPELAKSNVLLFGFSAAGVLAITTANYMPNRIIGVISYAGGSAQQEIDTVVPAQAALGIPFLVLSNDEDPSAGTSRDQIFFAKGWAKNAPWGRGIQHGVGHCCATSTKPIILPWIAAIITDRADGANALNQMVPASGVYENYTCTPNGIWAATGDEDCTFTAASLIGSGSSIAEAQGWLPDATTAAAWLTWVGH